jgi:hypothetical protein
MELRLSGGHRASPDRNMTMGQLAADPRARRSRAPRMPPVAWKTNREHLSILSSAVMEAGVRSGMR